RPGVGPRFPRLSGQPVPSPVPRRNPVVPLWTLPHYSPGFQNPNPASAKVRGAGARRKPELICDWRDPYLWNMRVRANHQPPETAEAVSSTTAPWITFTGHLAIQRPHRLHFTGSITARLFSRVIAP